MSEDEDTGVCSICADIFDDGKKRKVRQEHCCKQEVCLECMHRHIISVFREGLTGDGRKELKCPLGCGEEVGDLQIRTVLHEWNYSLLYDHLGRILYILWLIRHAFWYFLGAHTIDLNKVDFSTRQYNQKAYYTKTSQERAELSLYDRWSITVALSTMNSLSNNNNNNNANNNVNNNDVCRDANYHYQHVMRCPRPGCECLWLANRTYRNLKMKQETKYNKSNGKKSGMTNSLFQSASRWLFYTPMPAKKEEEIMNESGNYTTDHWLATTDIHPFRFVQQANINREAVEKNDGRKVVCPNCNFSFCGLCSRPWNTLWKNKRISHDGHHCSSYERKSTSAEDDFLSTADIIGAKCCPGCSMRTDRTEGCNHMTCPCGYEWCYICECRWNTSHYSCRATTSQNSYNANNMCIIS